MLRPAHFLTGSIVGAALIGAIRERRMRRQAERFSAAGLESLLRAIDANDAQTGAHARRVAAYALTIADACTVDRATRRTIELTALFHDIGKIHEALFDVVHEPRSLTPAERRSITTHPARGAEVLAPVGAFHPELANAVLSHHERWDGSGYPRGLAGQQIPFAARVVAIADTLDVITFGRRYRDGRALAEACELIAGARGTQFDPDLADLLALPPVVHKLRRATGTFARRGIKVPQRRDSATHERSPNVRIRWRTRTTAPVAVQENLDRSGS